MGADMGVESYAADSVELAILLELPQDDLIWEQERKVVSAEERMQKGQSHLANLKAMMAAKRGK